MKHVDDFIGEYSEDSEELGKVVYARWVLMHFRLPASLQMAFSQFIENKKLFCTFRGIRHRCLGASRLGDVWLTINLNQEEGYDKRVDVSQCYAWSDTP